MLFTIWFNGKYFSVKKFLRPRLTSMSALKGIKFGAALHESDVSSSCSYRISWGNAKNEVLKELWHDFVIENG